MALPKRRVGNKQSKTIKVKKLKFYNGQKGLRGENTDPDHPDVAMTPDRLEYMMRYEDDILGWAEKSCFVVHGDYGKVLIKLRDYQVKILNMYQENQKILINTTRQAGKSLLLALMVVHFILYNPDKIVGVISYSSKATKEILRRAKDIYSKLPLWMQMPVVTWNTETIELANGARVLTDIPKEDTLRGETISLILMDEMDHYDNDAWDALIRSAMPTLSSVKSHKAVYSSTPKGYKQMYKMKMDIEKGILDGYGYIEVPYTELPHADEAWVKSVKADIPDEANRENIFQQEYNNKFILLSNSLFSKEILESYDIKTPIINFEDKEVIFSKPVKGNRYSIGVDLSDGVGGDYAVIYVMDMTEKPFRIARIWRKNEFTYDALALAVMRISVEYNNAMTIIEDNNMGKIFIDNLTKLQFPNLVTFDGKKFGFNTNKGSKLRIIDNLNTHMLNGWIEINYIKTIDELSTFVKHPNKSYGAIKGKYDDIAMALMLALSITTHENYSEYNRDLMTIKLLNKEQILEQAFKRQVILF